MAKAISLGSIGYFCFLQFYEVNDMEDGYLDSYWEDQYELLAGSQSDFDDDSVYWLENSLDDAEDVPSPSGELPSDLLWLDIDPWD